MNTYTADNWNGTIDGENYGLSISEWCTGLVDSMYQMFFSRAALMEDLSAWRTLLEMESDCVNVSSVNKTCFWNVLFCNLL